jgi:steroid delta-isomerase-like uncharacterized protein
MAATWNARDLDAFLSYLTEDVVWDDPAMAEPATGREAVKRFGEAVFHAFPDFYYEVRHPICVAPDGSRCAVSWRIKATHLSRLDPPGLAPTNRQAVFDGVDLLDLRGSQVYRITTLFNVVIPAEQLLGWRLRPRPGTLRERLLTWAQRLRAAWLRTVK